MLKAAPRRILLMVWLLTVVPSARAQEDCAQLATRWRTGNYGLKASTGWPRRPDGETLALFEIDPMLAGLRRQVLGVYSQYHSGSFLVDTRGGVALADLIAQVEALETLYVQQPTPRLAEQIRVLRSGLSRAPVQMEEQIAPLKRRYQELQSLCRKARASMRDRFQEVCGEAPAEGFELTNWEALPEPPRTKIPAPLTGLDPGPPAGDAAPAAKDPAEDNPLWAELEGERGAAETPPPDQPTPEPVARWTPTPQPQPREAVAPASRLTDAQRRSFLEMLAAPDEEDEEAQNPIFTRSSREPTELGAGAAEPPGGRQRLPDDAWALFVESAAVTPTPADETLPIDPNAAPDFRESTLTTPDGSPTSIPEIAGDIEAAAKPVGAAWALGRLLLNESFTQGLGVERIGGTWTLENGILRGVGTERGDSVYVLARDAWVNYQLETDLQISGGRSEAGLLLRAQRGETRAGQVVHSQDVEEDGYVLRLRANGAPELSFNDSVELSVRRQGKLERVVCGRNADIPAHRWQKVSVRLDFSRIEIDLDGKRILSCRDDSFATGGAMLRLAGDTSARFDNVTIREVAIAGSDLAAPERGVKVVLPGESAEAWSRLGGRFVALGGMLYCEGAAQEPAMTRRDLAGVLQESGVSAEAMQLEVDLRSVGQQGGGGILMGLDSSRMYAVVLGPAEEAGMARVQLLRQGASGWEAMARQDLELDPAQWHRLALILEPGSLAIRVDGKPALRGRATLPRLESIGIYVDAGARVLADRLTLSSPGPR